ncbi:MAG: hypothetical protein GX986_11215 [Firmicutes bacterium]|nr:hypothetical protein [Bacillota bacterium]
MLRTPRARRLHGKPMKALAGEGGLAIGGLVTWQRDMRRDALCLVVTGNAHG